MSYYTPIIISLLLVVVLVLVSSQVGVACIRVSERKVQERMEFKFTNLDLVLKNSIS